MSLVCSDVLNRFTCAGANPAVLPNPEWALGGVRTSGTASDVRIDYVHHALSAVLGLRGIFGDASGAEVER